MMKWMTTALAALLVAQAAPAMAQDRGGRGDRAERRAERMEQRDRPQRDGAGWAERSRDRGAREAPRAAQPAAAPQAAAPAAAQAEPPRARFRGDGRFAEQTDRSRGDTRRSDDRRRDNGAGEGYRRDGDRRDRGSWDGGSWDGRRDHDRRADDRHSNDRRDWGRNDRNRRDNHRRWERGRYPPVYFSSYRYRYAWRPPSGFYVRSWSYGEFLPRGWYGPGYWIIDPWRYDLPLPPPGFDWVRSGPDALLIDQYSGRIVQVVRNIFWY